MNELLTTKDAADRLGLSVRGVQALIAKGVLPGERMGRDYLVRAADVERVKASRPRRGRPTTTGAGLARRRSGAASGGQRRRKAKGGLRACGLAGGGGGGGVVSRGFTLPRGAQDGPRP